MDGGEAGRRREGVSMKRKRLRMWCILDRANLRSGWAYFNLYPSRKQAEKTAKTIREKGNREAVVVKVRIPLPEEGD